MRTIGIFWGIERSTCKLRLFYDMARLYQSFIRNIIASTYLIFLGINLQIGDDLVHTGLDYLLVHCVPLDGGVGSLDGTDEFSLVPDLNISLLLG